MALIAPERRTIARVRKNRDIEDLPEPNPGTMNIREKGPMHIDFQWTDESLNWNDPCILQRSTTENTFVTPNLVLAQDIESNFIWIGIRGANRYVDLGLTNGTNYYYRACYITNYDSVVRDGASPNYTDWQYGAAQTETITTTGYNFVTDYGADNTGATNCWDAMQTFVADAVANSNRTALHMPAGTYLMYPTDTDVKWDGSYLTKIVGETHSSKCISGALSNTVIYGDVDGNGDPTTFINCRLWHNRPATEWLTVLKTAGGNPANDNDIYYGTQQEGFYRAGIKRYTFWEVDSGVENIELRNLSFDMTANPVSTGKRPGSWSFDAVRYEWDEGHKLMAGYRGGRNILVDNVRCDNTRGEALFFGGDKFEKVKVVDSRFRYLNSSAISMSANLEMENVTCSDTANAGMEMNQHARSGNDSAPYYTSDFSGLQYWHDCIVRTCTFKPLDQSVNGVMKDLSDLETADNFFGGLLIFNQKETFQTVTDSTIQDFRAIALGPWYECENVFYDNLNLTNPVLASCKIIYLDPREFTNYNLSGGMDYCYWSRLNITLDSTNLDNGGAIFRSLSSIDCQDNFIIDKVTIDGGGGSANRFWIDRFEGNGRSNFKCRDWSETNFDSNSNDANFIVNLNNPLSDYTPPFFEDFDVEWHQQAVGSLIVAWGQTKINGTGNITGISNINNLPIGSILKFKSASGTQDWAPDATWNNFTTTYQTTTSDVLTLQVVDAGTPKLQYVSGPSTGLTVYLQADFGAAGNGTTDDTTAVRNAINSGADTVIAEAGTYKISGDITLADGQDFDASLATWSSPSIVFFKYEGSTVATYTLQASVTAGANQVVVPGSASIATNDWIVVQDSASANGGNNQTKATPMELAQVTNNSSGTLTLDRNLAFDYTPGSVHKVTTVSGSTVDLGTLVNQRIDWKLVRNSSLTVECTLRPLQNFNPSPVTACDNLTINANLNYGAGSGPTAAGLLAVGWSNTTFNITSLGGQGDAVRLWGCANIAGTIDVTSPKVRGIWCYSCTGTLTNPSVDDIPYASANNIEVMLNDYSSNMTWDTPSITNWHYGDGFEVRGPATNVSINDITIESDGNQGTRNALNIHAFTAGCEVSVSTGSITGGGWTSVICRERVNSLLLHGVTITPEAGDTSQQAIYIGENMNGFGDQSNITIRDCSITADTLVPIVVRDEDGGGNTINNLTIDGLDIDYVNTANARMMIVWNTDNADISNINYTGAATNRNFDVSIDNTNLTVDEPSCNLGTGGFFSY